MVRYTFLPFRRFRIRCFSKALGTISVDTEKAVARALPRGRPVPSGPNHPHCGYIAQRTPRDSSFIQVSTNNTARDSSFNKQGLPTEAGSQHRLFEYAPPKHARQPAFWLHPVLPPCPQPKTHNFHELSFDPQPTLLFLHPDTWQPSNRVHVQGTGSALYMYAYTVAPVMFGKPLLNNVLAFDHVLLQE